MVNVFVTICGNIPVDAWLVDKIARLPGINTVDTPEASDCIFVGWTWRPEYVADPGMVTRILRSGKPVAVFDYLECGRDTEMVLTRPANWNSALEPYTPLADLEPAIKVYFKREHEPDKLPVLPYPVKATDFIGDYYPGYDEPVRPEAFAQRPINVFMFYGFSSYDRMMFHAELLRKHAHPTKVWMTPEDVQWAVDRGEKEIYALLYTPAHRRYPITDILRLQNMAKFSVCLRGASEKCFRHAESAYNSIMALQETTTQFAYPWSNRLNCLTLPNLPKSTITPLCHLDVAKAATALNVALGDDLYPIYLAGFLNSKRYIAENYIRDYWVPLLRQHGVWP